MVMMAITTSNSISVNFCCCTLRFPPYCDYARRRSGPPRFMLIFYLKRMEITIGGRRKLSHEK